MAWLYTISRLGCEFMFPRSYVLWWAGWIDSSGRLVAILFISVVIPGGFGD